MDRRFSLLVLLFGITGPVTGECPSGWIGHGHSCYFFSNKNRNWYDAGYTCEAIHSKRVAIDSEDENTFLAGVLSHFRGAFRSDSFWTEGTSEGSSDGSYKWATSQDPVTYTNWDTNEPNATVGDCVVLKFDRTWQSRNCHHDQGFICEVSRQQSDCQTTDGASVIG
ncbi:perlucin-like protein [Pecten maximus]|uniref:perlucin-like protein n=1 Tax=Pecten maximus TaxID=6579 RepID=UPI0014590386|nr:perlucin-like protein [Pecten maximus]